MFIVLAPMAIAFYAMYIVNPSHHGNIWLYVLQVIADLIAILIVSTLWLTILLDQLRKHAVSQRVTKSMSWINREKPSVDIYITAYNEPSHIVMKTITAACMQTYPASVYLLDDGRSEKLKEFCAQSGVHYISRSTDNRIHAKAGNINHGLSFGTGSFFAVLDADQTPKPEFIRELLPYFGNDQIALVQSPQHFTNTHAFIAAGTAQAQEIFYRYVQPAKDSFNASFCVGTNMLFRRSAIDLVGGIYAIAHSEDIWTTLTIHMKGYHSVFHPHILVEGRAPETIEAYFRQQSRWARGGFEMFFYRNPLFISNLSIDQRLQYLFSNFHYFSGFAILVYLMMPLMYLLFGQYPIIIDQSFSWVIHYVPYFSVVYFLPVFLLGRIRLATLATSLATFAPYIQSFVSVLLGARFRWISTGSARHIPIMYAIWPHMLLVLLTLFAVPIGWYNPADPITTAIISLWSVLNAYLLMRFIQHGSHPSYTYA